MYTNNKPYTGLYCQALVSNVTLVPVWVELLIHMYVYYFCHYLKCHKIEIHFFNIHFNIIGIIVNLIFSLRILRLSSYYYNNNISHVVLRGKYKEYENRIAYLPNVLGMFWRNRWSFRGNDESLVIIRTNGCVHLGQLWFTWSVIV